MSERTDKELLSAAREGDRGALERLLVRQEPRIYRFGMKMCRDPEDAKDVLQDTMLSLARGVRDFRGASSLSTWLYTVARSFCIKKRRKSKYAPEQEESLEQPSVARTLVDPGRAPDEEAAKKQFQEVFEDALQSLDPMYREVLVLRDMEGLTAPETAEVLDLTVEAVKSRLHRARRSIRDAVAERLQAPPRPATADGERCPDVAEMFSRQLEGELSRDDCAAMEAHLEACARCRQSCDTFKQVLATCRTTPTQEVPTEVAQQVRDALHDFLQRQPRSQG